MLTPEVMFAVARASVESMELDADLVEQFPAAAKLLTRRRAQIARELLTALELQVFAAEIDERLSRPLRIVGVQFPPEAE